MMILMMSLLIFGAVVTAAVAVVQSNAGEKNPVTLRLRELRMAHHGSLGLSNVRRPPIVLRLIAQLGGFMPAREGTDAMRTGLIRAGYRRADAAMLFLGSKLVLAVALPILWSAVAYTMMKPTGKLAMMTFVLPVVGFYLPTMWIAWRSRRRHGEIVTSLPDALDLMVVCVEAGLGMAAAIQRVGQEVRLASRALSDEFALVNSEMQTGVTRTDALRNLAERTGVEDIYSLVAMLIQTDRLGTSIAQSLRAHADSMRTKRRQRAEQMARKASIKLA
ncbi:MAG: type II secretion system F family protein, partial [Candidatus Eisenbacteria bacterium]